MICSSLCRVHWRVENLKSFLEFLERRFPESRRKAYYLMSIHEHLPLLGTDKSRGYCLEMICADFLAGANLDSGNTEILLHSIRQFLKFLPSEQQQTLVSEVSKGIS